MFGLINSDLLGHWVNNYDVSTPSS